MRCRSNASPSRPCAASASSSRADSPFSAVHHSSRVSTFGPVVTQPAPYRAASRSERGPLAAMMNGVRGRCTGPGSVRASTAEK